MQTLIKVSIIILLFAFLGKMCYKSCTKEIILRGIVISHATTSSKTGNITYYTIVRFNDGQIQNMKGLEFYVIPPGDSVAYATRILKLLKTN